MAVEHNLKRQMTMLAAQVNHQVETSRLLTLAIPRRDQGSREPRLFLLHDYLFFVLQLFRYISDVC